MTPYRAAFYTFLCARRTLAALRPGHGWRTWITPEILLGGFLLPGDVRELDRLGVGAVVNVTLELWEPVEALRAAGIEYLQVPCWDMSFPTHEDADRGVAFLAQKIAEGKRVYVHCASGVGRSVALVLCYLALHRGLAIEEALSSITSRRPRVALRDGQIEFVRAYVTSRAARRTVESAGER
jgi:protein-tyrosine phosphatase